MELTETLHFMEFYWKLSVCVWEGGIRKFWNFQMEKGQ